MAGQPGKSLALFDLLCLGVNAIVGSGIYLFPGQLAAALGPASVLAFVVCGLFSLLIGLSFAELSSRFDRSGGPYVYARAAFGHRIGFSVGWTCWVAAVMSWAAVTRGLMLQLGHFYGPLGEGALALATGIITIAVLALINVRGVKPGAITTDVLTGIKLLPLLALLVCAPFFFDASRLSPFAPHGLAPLPRASFLAFFAFQGFEVVPVPAGDARDPRKAAPFAVIASVVAATILYCLLQLFAVATTPELAGSDQPLALMARALFGDLGGQMVAGAAAISMLSFCAGVAFASPRYIEALAEDGSLPSFLGARHRTWNTPYLAILATAIATSLLVVVLDFADLVDLAVVFVGVQYLSTTAAVPILRRQQAQQPAMIRLPGGPVLPAIGFVSVAALLVKGLTDSRSDQLGWHFALILGVGFVTSWLSTLFDRRST